jgi:hypothetical protein
LRNHLVARFRGNAPIARTCEGLSPAVSYDRAQSLGQRLSAERGDHASIDAVRGEQSWDARGVDEDVVVVLPVAAEVVLICSNHHAPMLA